ncbi:MAG: aminotransferase class IV [Chthonomonadetes bacterium]|nr:aminotransferase class IV [Chthonomonadetes bacterium]
MQWAWKDGKLVPEAEACLNVRDGAVLHGASLFETLRCYSGHPFRLEAHLQRLHCWMQHLRLFARRGEGLDLSTPTIRSAIAQLLDACGLQERDARLRITVTAGSEHCPPSYFLLADEITAEQKAQWQRGIRAILLPDPRSAQTELPKWGSYAWNMEAQLHAQSRGAQEAIWVNSAGYLTEGAISNLFIWHEGILKTPPLQEGILAGITRQVVFQIAERLHIPCREERLPVHHLYGAQAVMLTNSVREIVAVTHLDDNPLSQHPIVARLQQAYRQLIEEEQQTAQ